MAHVTFKQMMNEVVAFGSCCECGTCVLVCPHNVIDYIDGKPKQVAKATAAFDFCGISEGIGCDVCAQVCPAPRRPRVRHARRGPAARGAGCYEGVFGRYRRVVAARCTDPEILARCQDGGVVTAILLRTVCARDCSTARASRPPTRPCPRAPKPKVVTTVDEAITSAELLVHVLPERPRARRCRAHGAQAGRFVGVPCQITPVRKMQLADPAFLEQRPQEGQAHRAPDEVPEGLRRRSWTSPSACCAPRCSPTRA